MRLEEEVDQFVAEWMKTIELAVRARDEKNIHLLKDTETLQGTNEAFNLVSNHGYRHLVKAADLLLAREKLSQKITTSTAVQILIHAFFSHKPKAIKQGFFSETAIINDAKARLAQTPRCNGLYVFPLVFAPLAKSTNVRFGPVRIQSKEVFLREFILPLKKEKTHEESRFDDTFYQDWEATSKDTTTLSLWR